MEREREKENRDNPSNRSKFSHVQKTKTEIEPKLDEKVVEAGFCEHTKKKVSGKKIFITVSRPIEKKKPHKK